MTTIYVECTDEFCKVDNINIKGENLAAALNRRIDAMVNDNRTRGDIIESMGNAAGISASTVRQILQGSINCPPMQRLQGFARVLNVSASSLVAAARRDGCNYDTDEDNMYNPDNSKTDNISVGNSAIEYMVSPPLETKAIDQENLILEHFITTEHEDRHGEVVVSKGIITDGHTGVLLGHNSRGEAIAKNLGFRNAKTKDGVQGKIAKTQFFDDEDGRRLFKKASQGFMQWSIGFKSIKNEPMNPDDGSFFTPRKHLKSLLVEYSLVAVAANPHTNAVKSNPRFHKSDLTFKCLDENSAQVTDTINIKEKEEEAEEVNIKTETEDSAKITQLEQRVKQLEDFLNITNATHLTDEPAKQEEETKLNTDTEQLGQDAINTLINDITKIQEDLKSSF